MNIKDIIEKKKDGKELSYAELEFAFNGFLNKEIPDYQISALLMAITINSMTFNETLNLTDIFIKSGEVLNLCNLYKETADKHSTGGIGDKVSLIVVPLVASCGIIVPKMSGRELGITGGTIDKLESIPGFKINVPKEDFFKELKDVGCAIIAQSNEIAPLDKIVYELRDVTATVSSVPLIASSIMSKKIALGAKNILIDLKIGKGALIQSNKDAILLKTWLENIGSHYDKNVRVIISNMDNPLGNNVGNALEVVEAIDVLKGKKGNLRDVCLLIAANIVNMTKKISFNDAKEMVVKNLDNNNALKKFYEMVKYQGGNIEKLKLSKKIIEIKSNKEGILKQIDAKKIGEITLLLGAGRMSKNDAIDYGVGLEIVQELGNKIAKGDILCKLYVKDNFINNLNIEDAFLIN